MARRLKGQQADEGAHEGAPAGAGRLRLDLWLWHVRAFRTRRLAADRINSGGVRVNGQPCRKPGRAVGPGDVVTFIAGRNPRVLEVRALGERRGPATEAATLYHDLTPPAPRSRGRDESAP